MFTLSISHFKPQTWSTISPLSIPTQPRNFPKADCLKRGKYSEGELVKTCLKDVVAILAPEKDSLKPSFCVRPAAVKTYLGAKNIIHYHVTRGTVTYRAQKMTLFQHSFE